MERHRPERTCLFCRRSGPKTELLRFVWSGEEVVWDDNHQLTGRGAYCHRRIECLSRIGDLSAWSKAFRVSGGELKLPALTKSMDLIRQNVPEARGGERPGEGLSNTKKRKVRL